MVEQGVLGDRMGRLVLWCIGTPFSDAFPMPHGKSDVTIAHAAWEKQLLYNTLPVDLPQTPGRLAEGLRRLRGWAKPEGEGVE